MRVVLWVVLSAYGSCGGVEPMAELSVNLQTLGAEVRVCASTALRGAAGQCRMPLVLTESWR